MKQNNIIILDRDGVINYDSKDFIKSPDEWRPIPGSLEAIAELNGKGYKIAIATNQSGISRGLYSLKTLEDIHQKMRNELKALGGEIAGIFYCPHGPDSNCLCRKPKPGLLKQIALNFSISLENTYCVGDSLRDIEASIAVNAYSVLVKTGNGLQTLEKLQGSTASFQEKFSVFDDLRAFAVNLLSLE